MSVIVWITEGTWPACVDSAVTRATPDEEIVLLYVCDDTVPETAHGAFAGLLGRGHPERDPGHRIEVLSEAAAHELLDAAERHLGGPARQVLVRGRTERKVVEAATGADLLVCARDGDRSRLGPHSLGPMTRFVVDHAPCPVLLVWPGEAPPTELPPPPPPHGPGRHH
ncbi:universal stress protein [Streptomyces sp. NPDC093228]|jgi:nucleotide-binding universal stress UspA family protein|uniref:universal stress protein n=1 Tax=unclassified Streptomyces TaxID=2593676 RepID=UPI000E278BD0|nr:MULTISPECIES: universal stress protein [unclassified Streptomyces]MDX3259751.1 universal stress protein [Streptomyces sp. MI02-2A]REE65351.1 nucleotide-binding universal stress UspA family protein [Streptomyces sp. 3212.3]